MFFPLEDKDDEENLYLNFDANLCNSSVVLPFLAFLFLADFFLQES